MPGNSPHRAIEAYIQPLQSAVSCLGTVKIFFPNKKPKNPGDEGFWKLGNALEDGMTLRDSNGNPLYFEASQRFSVLAHNSDCELGVINGRFRITTLMYAYNLKYETGGIQWHWHPKGNSPERRPHQHLLSNPGAHLPGNRFAFEDVIESVIELGAVPACSDWKTRLAESKGLFELYRSWSESPENKAVQCGCFD